MHRHLHRDMEQLQRMMVEHAAVVETMIDKAVQGLCHRRFDLLAEVYQLEEVVDRREVVIEEECLKVLALHQPVAIDLRRVVAILKVNNDMERIADLAVKVGNRCEGLSQYPEFIVPPETERIATMSRGMVQDSLDALIQLDSTVARRVMGQDDEVDELNAAIIDDLQGRMESREVKIAPALHCFSAIRNIERIADHAVNIAEEVIYLVDAEIVRHSRAPSTPKSS